MSSEHLPVECDHCRQVFAALDGRDLVAGGEYWRLEVFSVVEAAAHLWIQLRLFGRRPKVLTLCLKQAASVSEAMTAIVESLTRPGASTAFSNVA